MDVMRRFTYRMATPEDAEFFATLDTANYPDEPRDAQMLAHWWQGVPASYMDERRIAFLGEVAVGYLWCTLPPEQDGQPRYGRISADLLPEERKVENLAELFDLGEVLHKGWGAQKMAVQVHEDDKGKLDFLIEHGYVQERIQAVWELDLVARREALTEVHQQAMSKMAALGIRIEKLSDAPDLETAKRRIWEVSEEAALDVPRSEPHTPQSYEEFASWFNLPGASDERTWVAWKDGVIVGVSRLNYPKKARVWTNWTGVARSVRNLGVARALKAATVQQAIELGVPSIRTSNDSDNLGIIHLNRDVFGYQPLPSRLQLAKPVA